MQKLNPFRTEGRPDTSARLNGRNWNRVDGFWISEPDPESRFMAGGMRATDPQLIERLDQVADIFPVTEHSDEFGASPSFGLGDLTEGQLD